MESATMSHWSCPQGLKQTLLHWSNPIWLRPWSNGDPPLILQPRPAIRWCIDHFILDTGGPASTKPLISSFSTHSTMRQWANDPSIPLGLSEETHQFVLASHYESTSDPPVCPVPSPHHEDMVLSRINCRTSGKGRGERKGGLEGEKGTTQNRRCHSLSMCR